jgi:hypothetical protein
VFLERSTGQFWLQVSLFGGGVFSFDSVSSSSHLRFLAQQYFDVRMIASSVPIPKNYYQKIILVSQS